jgi:teichuronic acid biosynthesis glycosyltransferase TuaC
MAERVIVITTSFPRWPGDAAGHFVRSDARRRAEAGHEVHVICPDARASRQDDGLTVHGVGGEALFGWPGAWARMKESPARLLHAPGFVLRARMLVRELRAAKRSQLVAHWALPSAWPVAAGCSEPLEVVSHGADVRLLLGLPRRARTAIVRRLLSKNTTWVFVSVALREELMGGLDASLGAMLQARSRVEQAPIDVPPRDALLAPALPQGLESERYAIWVGRDVPSKRLDLAVEAAELAHVPLVLVGASRAFGSSQVRSLGHLPRHDTLSLIAHAGVLLSTSAAEGAPTAVREARALGVPVVACEAGDLERWAELDPGISLVAPEATAIASTLTRQLASRAERGGHATTR